MRWPFNNARTQASSLALTPLLVSVAAGCTGSIHYPDGSDESRLGATSEAASESSLQGDDDATSGDVSRSDVEAAYNDSDVSDADAVPLTLGDLSDVEVAAESVLASMSNGRYREGFPWVKVNAWPFQSAVADGTINVWVSGVGAMTYAKVAPELTHSGGRLPAGTVIVREVANPAGEVQTLTLMLKGPEGYNPDLGDFWFGITDPTGTPLLDEGTGAPRVGKLDGCYGCHVPRVQQGYLFGAPEGNRMPYLSPE